ncbi:hypothetical protein [Phenylobacterium deserti]|nr:hypothetical protein [Phenylobacterium deserti]
MRNKAPARRERALFTFRLILGAQVAFAALNAQAGEKPQSKSVAAAFGNTVVSTYPDGRTQRIWLKEDGSFRGLSRRGNPIAGAWTLKGEQVCLKQSRPVPLPISYCTDFPASGGLGSEWTSKDLRGTPIRLSLQKGVELPN